MSLRVFCAVSELNSFTAAADCLGISLPMASKHVRRLEQHLGTRLFYRTPWHVTLTKTGTLYFEPIRHLLIRLDEVEAAVRKAAEFESVLRTHPKGTKKSSVRRRARFSTTSIG
jgi:DNA-binding transcriptional LysR family regulator